MPVIAHGVLPMHPMHECMTRGPPMQQAPATRALYKDLLNMDNEISMHTQALQALRRSYKPSEAATDFRGVIQGNMDRLLASQP